MRRDKSKLAAAPFRLSWPAIFGGMFAASGTWLLLHALGLALGFSTLEPTDTSALRATGIGGGVWTLLTSIISLFVGGMVTTRSAGLLGRSNAGLHGVVLWGVTTVGGLILIASVLASLARGVAGVTMQGASASQAALPGLAQGLGIDSQELLGPVNARLQERGQPTVTAEQLDAAMRDAASTALRSGRLDREMVIASVVEHTKLTRADVDEVLGSVSQQLESAQQQIGQTAERAATITGRAFWGVFAVMVLSLVSSVLGAIAGVTPRQRELSAQVAALPVPQNLAPTAVY